MFLAKLVHSLTMALIVSRCASSLPQTLDIGCWKTIGAPPEIQEVPDGFMFLAKLVHSLTMALIVSSCSLVGSPRNTPSCLKMQGRSSACATSSLVTFGALNISPKEKLLQREARR